MTARPEPTLGADERERFIEWARLESLPVHTDVWDDYRSPATSAAWTAWQARAALDAPAVVVSAEPVAEPFGYVNGGRSALTSPRWMSKERNQFYDTALYLATPVGPDAVDGWQPIETAPQDGSEFLAVWGRQSNIVQIVKWNAIHKFWQTKGEPLMGFANNATAWMPLPKPPIDALASTKPSKGAA